MADTMVSARISVAKKEAGVAALKEIGATTSDLINSAFDYVLKNKKLPSESRPKKPTPEQIAKFKKFVQATTIDVDWGDTCPDGDYKKLMREWRIKDYESLS